MHSSKNFHMSVKGKNKKIKTMEMKTTKDNANCPTDFFLSLPLLLSLRKLWI